MRLRSAMRITARCSAPPIRTAITCGRVGWGELHVEGEVRGGGVEVTFRNSGKAGAAFHVRFADESAPMTYTVAAGHETADTLGDGSATYDFAVYGPNGFLRTFAGGVAADRAHLEVEAS